MLGTVLTAFAAVTHLIFTVTLHRERALLDPHITDEGTRTLLVKPPEVTGLVSGASLQMSYFGSAAHDACHYITLPLTQSLATGPNLPRRSGLCRTACGLSPSREEQVQSLQKPFIYPDKPQVQCNSGCYGLTRWRSSEESACQCRRYKRCGFHPWVGKIPWGRKW